MEIKDRLLIDKINLSLIEFTATAIHYCQAAWETVECRVPPECDPEDVAQYQWDPRRINNAVKNAHPDLFHCLNADFHCSSQAVYAIMISNIRSII